jgi:hypothetical protein
VNVWANEKPIGRTGCVVPAAGSEFHCSVCNGSDAMICPTSFGEVVGPTQSQVMVSPRLTVALPELGLRVLLLPTLTVWFAAPAVVATDAQATRATRPSIGWRRRVIERPFSDEAVVRR